MIGGLVTRPVRSLRWFKSYPGFLVVAVALAASLRLFQLGQVPAGMTWDEAAIAYNGFSVTNTYRDEWLERLPISFRSFGDYKAPLAIYLNGLITWVLGLELWAVRLPFALSGILAVALMGAVSYRGMVDSPEVTQQTLGTPGKLAVAGAVLLAVSPWHHHFSRAGFESGLALTLLLTSVWSWQRATVTQHSQPGRRLSWLLVSALAATLSMYAYHSAKVVAPLLGLTLVWLWWPWVRGSLKQVAAAGAVGLASLIPMIYDTLFNKGATRLSQTSIFTDQAGSAGELILTVFLNILRHLSPAFLAFGQTTTLRHGDGRWGVLFITTLGLVLAAVLGWIWRRHQGQKLPRVVKLALVWIAISFVPAVISREVPHSNRVLLGLPGFILLALSGVPVIERATRWLANHLRLTSKRTHLTVISVLGTIMAVHGLLSVSYLHDYYTRYAADSTTAFQEGYLEAFEYVISFEQGQRDQDIEKIVFSSTYGQPYIYALLTRRSSPYEFHAGTLIKYEFADVDIGDLSRTQTVVVAAGSDDVPISQADHLILGTDQSVRFAIYVLE